MSKVYDCQAKVVSPVFIGSGDKYGASEYVHGVAKLKDKKVKTIRKIDVSKYYLSLDDAKKDQFIRDLSNPNFSLYDFDKKIANTYRIYNSLNYCKEQPTPNQEISENIKTLNEAYVPGTSIKGAIKTAILYNMINVEKIPEIIEKVIKRSNRGPYINRRDYENVMSGFFSTDNRKAPQTNIMKFLHVSDTSTIKTPAIYDVFTVMASNLGGRKSNQLFKNGIRIFLETIRPGHKLNFSIVNTYDKNIYSSLNLANKENLIEIDNIKSSVYNFSKDFINHEKEFSEDYGISYLSKFYKQIEKLNTPSAPLLKVGGGSGFLATTIGLKVLEYDDLDLSHRGNYYLEKIRNEIDPMDKNTYKNFFPKSRKVTSVGRRPLGWVQLSFNAKEE